MGSESKKPSGKIETLNLKDAEVVIDFLLEDEVNMPEDLKLRRQMFRYGLDPLTFKIEGEELPAITAAIDLASRRKSEKDMKFLKTELERYGFDMKDFTSAEMRFILFRIAGISYEEMTVSLKQWTPVVGELTNLDKRRLNQILQERDLSMLRNPELDWTSEKIGTNSIPKLSVMLNKMTSLTGLNPEEIFDIDHMPRYIVRDENKQNPTKTLKNKLYTIILTVENPNWKEIERKSDSKKSTLIDFMIRSSLRTDSTPYPNKVQTSKAVSLKLIRVFCNLRIQMQIDPKNKIYPKDNVDYMKVLKKLDEYETAKKQE